MPRLKKSLFLITLFILPTVFSLFFYYFVIRKPITERNTDIYIKLPYYGPRKLEGKDTVYFTLQKFEGLTQDSTLLNSEDPFLQNKLIAVSCLDALDADGSNRISSQFIRAQDKLKFLKIFRIISLCNYNDKNLTALKNYNAKVHVDPKVWNFIAMDSVRYNNYFDQNFLEIAKTTNSIKNKIFLIDKNLNIRGVYDGVSIVDVNRMMDEVRVLIAEYRNKTEKQQFVK